MLQYLRAEQYGIWVTLSSLVGWSIFFDFGLVNGMRTKIARARAEGNDQLARIYISTAYVAMALFSSVLMLVALLAAPWVDFQALFNTRLMDVTELRIIFCISVFFTLLIFTMSTVNSVLNACQKSAYIELNQMLISISWLVVINLLLKATQENMALLVMLSGTISVLCLGVVTLVFFSRYPMLIPHLKYVDLSRVREVVSLGGRFFLIQIAYLVIFTTDNLIITQVMGPDHVTTYSIVFKLFSVITLVNGMVTANLWSAYTEAYVKKDYAWIEKALKKLNFGMILVIAATLILALLANSIMALWFRKEFLLPSSLIILMGIYVVVSVWSQIYSYFLNGIGKINIQVYLSVSAAVINIPISVYFAKHLGIGSAGVILGTIVSLSLFAIAGPIQTYWHLSDIKRINANGPS